MCLIDEASLDHAFVPTLAHINFIKGMIVGSREAHPGNEQEFAVYQGWVYRNLPSPDANVHVLMEAGYVLKISEQFDGCTTLALTHGAEQWCERNGLIPAIDSKERMGSREWIKALIYEGKRRRAPSQTRKGTKNPTPRTTSQVVRQISYAPEEAVAAHAYVVEMYEKGYITERTAAGYKATITRRIQKSAA